MKIDHCLICDNQSILHVLDLGSQPLANDFLSDPNEVSDTYPLHLYRCPTCFHSQINYNVDRSVLFKNYVYESGTSQTMRNYFKTFAETYTKKLNDGVSKRVLDIACNDGSQLDEFKHLGWQTVGVDPAENLVGKARTKGHTIDCSFWGMDPVQTNDIYKDLDLIVAQNVLAHVPNPIDFLQACANVMNEKTLLVVQTSQSNMFINDEFDTIYHEHLSFFTVKSMKYAAQRVGCTLVNVYKVPVHGSSYVFELRKGTHDVYLELEHQETNMGLYGDSLYTRYEKNIELHKKICKQVLQEHKDMGYQIIGFGAAAKGNVFLNYVFDSAPHPLCPEVIIDESPLKQNTYTAGTLIPIVSIEKLDTYADSKVAILILAWNFTEEIMGKIRRKLEMSKVPMKCCCISFFPRLTQTFL